MAKQITFASLAHATKKKVTRREKFLAVMEAVVSEDGQQRWAASNAVGSDAADLLLAAVVCAE